MTLHPTTDVSFFAQGLDHPEGLAFAPDGKLYAGGEAGQIYRISPDGGEVVEVAAVGGFCLGIAFDRHGDLFICDKKAAAVVRLTATGTASVFADGVAGTRMRQPNFPVFDPEGNLYVSDSGDWQGNNGLVYRFRPDGRGDIFAGPFNFANGLALDADASHLYVVESNNDDVIRIPIRRDGTAGPCDIYARDVDHVPDGLAFDGRGHLYVTCYASDRIYVIDTDGHAALLVEDPDGNLLNRPTNCAFGGPAFDELYIANLGGYHISKMTLATQGQPLCGGLT